MYVAALQEDGAELIGQIADDADHRQAQGSGGSGQLDDIAEMRCLSSAARFSARITPFSCAARRFMVASSPAMTWRCTRRATRGQVDGDDHDGLAVKLHARQCAPAGLRRRPGHASNSCCMAAGKRKPCEAMFSVVETNMSGFRVSFIHSSMDWMLARATPPCADHQRQREHQRGNGGGGAARRLDQAVGGQRAFHRTEPFHGPPQEAGPAPARETG